MSRIVIFMNPKGGVGKTFLSVKTSMKLAETATVLLVEGKNGMSDAAVLLELADFRKLAELGNVAPGISSRLLGGFLSTGFPGLDFVSMGGESQAGKEEIRKILPAGYGYIIIDGGNLADFERIGLLDLIDMLIIVTTPELLSIRQSEYLSKQVRSFHFPSEHVRVIVNSTSIHSDIPVAEIADKIGSPLLFELPFEQSLSRTDRFFKQLTEKIVSELEIIPAKSGRYENLNADTDGVAENTAEYCALKEKIHSRLIESFHGKKLDERIREEVTEHLERIMSVEAAGIRISSTRQRLAKEILDEALGLGPVEDLLRDPEITEIMVNGRQKIYIEKKGIITLTEKSFASDKHLMTVIERIVSPAGRRIDESSPLVDARLSDGSRINAVIPPLSLKGPILTIRRFPGERLKIDGLIKTGSISASAAEFLKICVRTKKNILISGGTGSGKTTLLNILSSFIPPGERIITIEDSAELQLHQEHVLTLETRPPNIEGRGAVTIRDLVRNSLRMRPDRIVIGECRGVEALDMLQAMNTGHEGSLTTIHANSPADAMSRLETMILMAEMELPLPAIRRQISSALDIIVQQARIRDGQRKIVAISEVAGFISGEIVLNDIFTFDSQLLPTGYIPEFIRNADTEDAINIEIFKK